MSGTKSAILVRLKQVARRCLAAPQMLAILPAACLVAYWTAGELALILTALILPVLSITLGILGPVNQPARACDTVTGLPLRDTLETRLDHALDVQQRGVRRTMCLLVQIDDFDLFEDRYGQAAADTVLHATARRIRRMLRDDDTICKMGKAQYGIAVAPVAHLDLESAIQLCSRLQAGVEEPLQLDATTVYVSCSIGFCLGSRSPMPNGASLLSAAQAAMAEALRYAPSAIRSYAASMHRASVTRSIVAEEAAAALEKGQIKPYFQPQVSTDTGLVTGFEALARWTQPERGLISPAEFLPVIQQSGQMERLGDVILLESLTALRQWDAAGLKIPRVGVNFTNEELMNPRLVEKIRWQLDRFCLSASRLSVEVLETVIAASPDDVISRNINGLAQMGCHIDLDDFGTGHASISSVRRFSVGRLKIDRSFVMKVDRDLEQQRMVAAILTMAERLGLETLAEGVETPGEHAMLAQLGCGHIQGYEIARPMPFEQTIEWIKTYHASLIEAPKFGRRGE